MTEMTTTTNGHNPKRLAFRIGFVVLLATIFAIGVVGGVLRWTGQWVFLPSVIAGAVVGAIVARNLLGKDVFRSLAGGAIGGLAMVWLVWGICLLFLGEHNHRAEQAPFYYGLSVGYGFFVGGMTGVMVFAIAKGKIPIRVPGARSAPRLPDERSDGGTALSPGRLIARTASRLPDKRSDGGTALPTGCLITSILAIVVPILYVLAGAPGAHPSYSPGTWGFGKFELYVAVACVVSVLCGIIGCIICGAWLACVWYGRRKGK